MNSQKEMGLPARAAMPRTTTLALAPMAVALPPKSAPRARGYQRASEWVGSAMSLVSPNTSGIIRSRNTAGGLTSSSL
ncbi:hypothetical protein AVL48_16360 [Amycolatopsis regifaucium]|uniref:Uncharacterized protein n=1 Tax=Amycolatopsis regifaucium TaxID=546365 RepID=A0A154M479_9PSEU|nr:hypothetical protein AVL48_16360 [Amycolatopsis regifaucium]